MKKRTTPKGIAGRGGPSRWVAMGLLLCGLAAGGPGCLQIETHVKLNEDGSARVTERMFFSERLLDLAGDRRGELAALLGKERLLERMKLMGEGLTLAGHETREGGDGWMESVAMIDVADLNKFRYVSPWLAYGDYASNSAVRARLTPQYKSQPYAGGAAGSMSVRFVHEKPAQGGGAPKTLTPQEQQAYRDLAPAIRDMLRGLRLRFTFEAYAPVGGAIGGRLLDVSDANLDQMSQAFFENEEIMLELLRLDFGGPNVAANVCRNATLPAFLPLGSRAMWWIGSDNLWFPPSRPLFDRYFQGKKLDYAQWQPSPPEKHVEALYEKIGWNPPKKDPGAPERKPVPGSH
jgi:hypothetical protein